MPRICVRTESRTSGLLAQNGSTTAETVEKGHHLWYGRHLYFFCQHGTDDRADGAAEANEPKTDHLRVKQSDHDRQQHSQRSESVSAHGRARMGHILQTEDEQRRGGQINQFDDSCGIQATLLLSAEH